MTGRSCTLLGIVPPEKNFFDLIQSQMKIENVSWQENFVIVPDQENDGALTLIISAIIRGTCYDDNEAGEDCRSKQQEQPYQGLTLPAIQHPQDIVNLIQTFLTAKRCECVPDMPLPRVELWASAPAPLPLWNEKYSCRSSPNHVNMMEDDAHEYCSDVETKDDGLMLRPALWTPKIAQLTLQKWGIVLQKKLLHLQEIKLIRAIVDEAIEKVEMTLLKYRPDIDVGKDTMIFKEIASRNLERFDLRLTSDQAMNFVRNHVLNHLTVQDFLSRTLGDLDGIDFDISVVYSRPGANTQGWHADGAHLNTANDAGWDDDGWRTRLADAYAICLFVPLIDLNHEVGFTQFWPGSHRSRDLIGFGPVAELTCSTFDAIGSSGDGIWYDYRLLHRGMPNRSSVIRPVLQILFKKKWYVERANYGHETIANTKKNKSTLTNQ